MSVISSNILAGASGQGGGYNLTRSLRFRRSASAYLNRTPSSAGNRRTWTYSAWIKRGLFGEYVPLLSAYSGDNNNETFIMFDSTNSTLRAQNAISGTISTGFQVVTTPVYRDPSAWYHVIVAVDTTQASVSNAIKMYINGIQVTSFGTQAYGGGQNQNTFVNATNTHLIGMNAPTDNFKADMYLTEVNFIDGQQLTPSSFGENSATTGVWQPKRYTGTYGTNGFYLPFTDNSSTTSGSNAGLGKDFSGNGNYWNTNNISLTAGSTYDSMTDVPTLTSATAANFCTWNPLDRTMERDTAGLLTWSNGNLYASTSQGVDGTKGTIWLTPSQGGKYYFEIQRATSANEVSCGIASEADTKNTGAGGQLAKGGAGLAPAIRSNGDLLYNNVLTSGWSPSISINDIIGVAVNCDTGAVYFSKNGAWINGSGGTTTFGSAANASTSGLASIVTPFGSMGDNDALTLNCGQRPFAYTPPTGYVSINTYNLPTPTIGATASTRANKYFDATLYTGTGSAQSIVNAGGFAPDFVWAKSRSNAYPNVLVNQIVGATKYLVSNNTDAETTDAGYISALNSNGFSVGSSGGLNVNGGTFVGWQWKANGAGSSNTAGSITSTVSANTSAGFSIVTYTGNGSAGATVGHGLSVAPKMLIIKARDGAGYSWKVYHGSLGSSYHLELESTGGLQGGIWNSTNPSSTVFTLGTNAGVNENGKSYVAYVFADVSGYSKLGSYAGNGSSDGAFIHTGFRPKFVMIRSTSNLREWFMVDTARNTYNVVNTYLRANTSAAQGTDTVNDIVSNGFKLRNGDTAFNGSGETYIYMAFAENPFKYSLAR